MIKVGILCCQQRFGAPVGREEQKDSLGQGEAQPRSVLL